MGRLQDRGIQELWTLRHSRQGLGNAPPGVRGTRAFNRLAVREALAPLPASARLELIEASAELLQGRLEVLGTPRTDLLDPDWSLDPTTGQRYPESRCAFRVDYRAGGDRRQVKQVWELSRHHHLTMLAAAWALTGDEAYAEMVARHLRSWWDHNEVLSGCQLGQRHRDRDPTDLMGLGTTPARRLARGGRLVRAQ